jgi:hypothetical protein
VRTADQPIDPWLGDLGSGSPTPGGGAAAGVAAATGAALIAMVGHLTIGKSGFEDLDARMRSLVETADGEREAFLALADQDAQAFESVMASFKLPKETDEEKSSRTLRIQEAYEAAAEVPLQLAKRAVQLMELAEPPDPRREELLPVVAYSVKRRLESAKATYWDYATMLELAVLAGDEEGAMTALADAVAAVPDRFQPESTVETLRRLRAARQERGPVPAWMVEVEETLQEAASTIGRDPEP